MRGIVRRAATHEANNGSRRLLRPDGGRHGRCTKQEEDFAPSHLPPPGSAENSMVAGLIAHGTASIGLGTTMPLERQNAIIGLHVLGKCARKLFESELRHSFLIQAQSI